MYLSSLFLLCYLFASTRSQTTVSHKYYEIEINDQIYQANKQAMVPPFLVYASLRDASDYDWFNVSIVERGVYVIETFSPSCQSNTGSTDTEVEIFSVADVAHALASDDDGGVGLGSRIEHTLDAGLYFVRVRSFSHFSKNAIYELAFGHSSDVFCERDCSWTSWTAWTACSKPCGGGIVARRRISTICPPQDYQIPCNVIDCATSSPRCTSGDWSTWGTCDHDSCTSERYRAKNLPVPAATSRQNCTSPYVESEAQACECSIIAVDSHEEMENLTLTPPVRIEASLRRADTDNFKFYFTPGQYVIQTYAPCSYSCTIHQDTKTSVLYGDRSVLAFSDDNGPFPPCDELKFLINDEGLYFVSITSFDQWKEMGRYGVVVKPIAQTDFHPMCTDQIRNHKWGPTEVPTTGHWNYFCYPISDHSDYESAIYVQSVPFYVTKATLDSVGKDFYLVQITETDRYVFYTLASTFDKVTEEGTCWDYDCDIDTILEVRDRYGTVLARNDDYFRSCSSISKILDPGYYFIVVSAFASTSRAGHYSLIGVKSDTTADSVTWCPSGTTPRVCPTTTNSIHSLHPVWIALFVALGVFVLATIAIGLSTHCGRTFYRPLTASKTGQSDGENAARDDTQVELDEFASS